MLILPNDIIPKALDLIAVIQHFPTVYEQGYRALDITIHMGNKIATRNFHFSKVCSSLIGNCCELTNLIILSCVYAYLSTIITRAFLLQNLLWIKSQQINFFLHKTILHFFRQGLFHLFRAFILLMYVYGNSDTCLERNGSKKMS